MPARERRFAEVIAQSGASLLAIINDILDFSKIEAGKLELESVAVDPIRDRGRALSLFWERRAGSGAGTRRATSTRHVPQACRERSGAPAAR